jgi:hypothetical protein
MRQQRIHPVTSVLDRRRALVTRMTDLVDRKLQEFQCSTKLKYRRRPAPMAERSKEGRRGVRQARTIGVKASS